MRKTLSDLASSLATTLATAYSVPVSVRYYRVGEYGDLPTNAAYYVEPSKFKLERVGTGSPSREVRLRFVSEERVDASTDYETTLASRVAFFEGVGIDQMKTPTAIQGAFLKRVESFVDAPSFYSVDAAQDGTSTIFAGVEFVYEVE